MNTPWAIILCKYADDDSEPYPRQRFEELFTAAGAGTFNMPDFFNEMSHGRVDLSGSRVFGWHTLTQSRSDYAGSGANQQGRTDLITWARRAEPQVASYFSVVAVMNVPTDLFGSPYGVATDDGRMDDFWLTNLSPSMLGQEMGHAYGLQHSMREGSAEEYQDRWDTMSTALYPPELMAAHPVYTERDRRGNIVWRIGPGLNAAQMWGRGWLDDARTWHAGASEWSTRVELRPLHQRDLPGYLVARVGRFFVEFRVPERWDGGIGSAVVLVHAYVNDTSVLMNATSGAQFLNPGDSFRDGHPADPSRGIIDIRLLEIDGHGRRAVLEVTRRPARRTFAGPAVPLGSWRTGGQTIVFVGGRPRRIPPRSPLAEIIDQASLAAEIDELLTGPTRALARRDALTRIRDRAERELERLDGPRDPSPAERQKLLRDGADRPTPALPATRRRPEGATSASTEPTGPEVTTALT